MSSKRYRFEQSTQPSWWVESVILSILGIEQEMHNIQDEINRIRMIDLDDDTIPLLENDMNSLLDESEELYQRLEEKQNTYIRMMSRLPSENLQQQIDMIESFLIRSRPSKHRKY